MISTKKKFIGIFISIILVIGLAIPVFASAGVEVTKEDNENIILYLNEENGKDTNEGISAEKAVKSLKKIKELFEEKIKEMHENADVLEDISKTIVVCSDKLDEKTTEKLKDEDIDVLTLDEYEKAKENNEATPVPDEKSENEDKDDISPTPSSNPIITENPTLTPTVEPTTVPSISPEPTVEPTVNPDADHNRKTITENTDKESNKDSYNDSDEIAESEINCQAVEENETIEAQNVSDKNTEAEVSDTATAQINEAANQPAVMSDISTEAVNDQAVQAEAVNTGILRSLPGRDLVGHGTTKKRTQSTSAVTSNNQTTYNNSVTPTATTLAKGGSVQTGNEDNVLVYTVCACLSICALVFVGLLSVERKRRANNLKMKEKVEKFKDSIK